MAGVYSRRAPLDTAARFPPKLGGRWASGLPFLDPGLKKRKADGGDAPGAEEAGVQLALTRVDVRPAQVLPGLTRLSTFNRQRCC